MLFALFCCCKTQQARPFLGIRLTITCAGKLGARSRAFLQQDCCTHPAKKSYTTTHDVAQIGTHEPRKMHQAGGRRGSNSPIVRRYDSRPFNETAWKVRPAAGTTAANTKAVAISPLATEVAIFANNRGRPSRHSIQATCGHDRYWIRSDHQMQPLEAKGSIVKAGQGLVLEISLICLLIGIV